MQSFPRGACGDASILLGEYLHRQGQDVLDYVAGERESDLYSHAWLEKDGLIVDITADQFEGVSEPVIVTYDRTWHQQFVYPEDTHPALIETYDSWARQNLVTVYQEVVYARY
jgi:hypothetical protein